MVLTVSETSAAAIREWLGDESVDVRVVGNGKSFQSLPIADLRDVAAGRRDHDRALRLLYVGNLKVHKGFPTVLRALTCIPEATLAVVTADEAEVRRVAAALSPEVGERVLVRSDVSDEGLSRLYDESDVLVMPSREEGFGLPALEALAHALPVVYWGGCTGLLETLGGYGHQVEDAEDGPAWAAAIQEAAGSGVRVDRGLGELLSRYDWEAVAARVAAAIAELEHRT
jgi:glycosyltransferase involved in cell wall biosynthesis